MPTRTRLRGLVLLGLVAATFAVYGQVRHHDFVDLDDTQYVAESAQLRAGLTPDALRRSFTEAHHFNWAPLTTVSYQIDYAIHGLEPGGYLLGNVALHALAAALLFLFLERATGATGRSGFVAAVFALHPLHVESVAWVSSRKDVLSGVFFMLTLLAWARYAERPGSRLRYAAVALAFTLGLLSKATLVTLPVLLLLVDVWPLGRLRGAGARRLLLEKLPLLVLALAAGIVTVEVQRATHAVPLEPPPLDVRLWNAVHSYAVYAFQTLWPAGLACFYPYPGPAHAPSRWQLAGEGALLVALTLAALRRVRTRPELAVGWLWYGIALLPTIGLIQTGMQARADRYTYLPQIGLAIAVAWGTWAAVGPRVRARRVLAAAAGAGLVALAAVSWLQVHHWRDSAALYAHALAVTEGNFVAHKGLGAARWRQGRLDEALAHYRESIRLKPDWSLAHHDLGALLVAMGRPREALPELEQALRIRPGDVSARRIRGVALVQVGRHAEARAELRRVIDLGPPSAELYAHLAVAESGTGHDAEALAAAERALALARQAGDEELAAQVRALLSRYRAAAVGP